MTSALLGTCKLSDETLDFLPNTSVACVITLTRSTKEHKFWSHLTYESQKRVTVPHSTILAETYQQQLWN